MESVMKNYLEESSRTASDAFHSLNVPGQSAFQVLANVFAAGNTADVCKRGLYYGTDHEKLQLRVKDQVKTLSNMVEEIREQDDKLHPGLMDPNLLHGTLGIASEVGELAEQLVNKALRRENVDYVNISEEVGDILWYCAMILRACGKSFEDVATQNIAKLKVRYPHKFTLEKAETRDLFEERKILEETNA